MKKILFWLPAFIFLVGFSSCTEEDDGLNGPYRNWVTIYQNDNTPTMVTDRNLFLHVTNAQPDSTFYEVGDRGNMLYTLVDETHSNGSTYQVVMKEFIKATIKPIVYDTSAVYKDARLAEFTSALVLGNYLNVLVKTFDSNDAVNSVELVRYPDEEIHLSTDSLPVIRVRLQHNVSSVKSSKKTQAFCFDLSHLRIEFPGKAGYILRFSWKSANDEQEYNLRYNNIY